MSVKTLKYVALAETISWTLLLISMIFKYGFDQAGGVQIMGPIHGMLTIALIGVTLILQQKCNWGIGRSAKILLSSLIPIGGYFLIEHTVEETPAVSQA
jgi:integral membrane protein